MSYGHFLLKPTKIFKLVKIKVRKGHEKYSVTHQKYFMAHQYMPKIFHDP